MAKRVIFSESDCHLLIDIINNFKEVIESKKTDSSTWKDKIAAWINIAELYNASTTEHRTWEQLRCKYDNLKKDVRKHRAKLKRNLTGGDKITLRKSTQELYDKIYKLISVSVDGLSSCKSESDEVGLQTIENGYKVPIVLADSKKDCGTSEIYCDLEPVNDPLSLVAADPAAITKLSQEVAEQLPIPACQSNKKKFVTDRRNDTNKMLRTKKAKVFRSKASKEKKELHEIETKILLLEHCMETAPHKMKMKLEKDLRALKMEESIKKKKLRELEKLKITSENTDITEECEDEVTTVPEGEQTPQLNSIPTKKRNRIDISSEILLTDRQMKESFEHEKGSINDEYEIFGKLIASKLRTIKNANTKDILMNDMHYMISRACMIDRMNQDTVLPQSHNQIHHSPLCSIFHSSLNQICQLNPTKQNRTSPHSPQYQVPSDSMSSPSSPYPFCLSPIIPTVRPSYLHEVPSDLMSSQSLQNEVDFSPPSVTPEPSPTEFKPSKDIKIPESCLLSNFPASILNKTTNRQYDSNNILGTS